MRVSAELRNVDNYSEIDKNLYLFQTFQLPLELSSADIK